MRQATSPGCWTGVRPEQARSASPLPRLESVTDADRQAVNAVIDDVTNPQRKQDAGELLQLMSDVTGEEAKVWSANTIGFGQYHYRYKSGQEGDFFTVGFSPRKDRTTLYIMSGLRGFEDILDRLGPHTASKSTVHIKRLQDVDRSALTELIDECVRHIDAVQASLGAIPRMSDIPPRVPGT